MSIARPPPPLPPHPHSDFGPPQYRSSNGSPPVPPKYHVSNTSLSESHASTPQIVKLPESPATHSTRWTMPPPQSPPPPQRSGSIMSPMPVPRPPSVFTPPSASTQTYYSQPPPPQPPPHQHSSPQEAAARAIPALNLLDGESAESDPLSPQASPAPAPPRPPNPELLQLHAQIHQKLTSEFASLAQALAVDTDHLRANQTDLLVGEPAIRDEMARLVAVRDVCRNVAGRMRGTVDHAERNVAELRRKGDPEVDELVCSTTIVHNQYVNFAPFASGHQVMLPDIF